MSVIINKNELQFILNHAKSTYPEECCGFLLGVDSGIRRINRVLPAKNANQNSRRNRYNIDPKELIRADEEARRLRLELIGIYHSHPDAPAQPSSFDLEHAWPWYIYVVLSVPKGEPRDVAAWCLTEDRSRFNRDDLKIMSEE
jgi:proteasome lid subunit RPN8/RPN11